MTSKPTTDSPLLSIDHLSVEYRARAMTTVAVQDVSLALHAGETLALVGESGSGKSTLASALFALLPAGAHVTGGQITFEGRDVLRMTESQRRVIRGGRIALVPQDPRASLDPLVRVGEQVAEALAVHGVARGQEAAERAIALLDQMKIPDARVRSRQYPHEFSGGMLQRVLIAMAIACDPAVIIADEPTSGLDPTVQRAIMNELAELSSSRGRGMLLITHDLALALDRADRVAVMYRGSIVESGSAAAVFEKPSHEYTRRLVASVQTVQGALPRPVRQTSAPDPMVTVDSISVGYGRRSGRAEVAPAVDDVSFTVERGTTLAIVGESGSGKSTIVNVLLGLVSPTAGTVAINGQELAGLRPRAWRDMRRNLQPVFQSPYTSLDPRYTVGASIEEPLKTFESRAGVRAERVRTVLAEVGLPEEFLAKRPSQLSGGQRQRVAIARAIALSPGLVVLDEPTSALDVITQAQVLDLLRKMQQTHGLTFVFVSHDLGVVRSMADSVLVLHRGRVVETGTTDEIFNSPHQSYTRELLGATLVGKAGTG